MSRKKNTSDTVTEKTSLVESYADSLFQVSIYSSKIASASILIYENGRILMKKSYGYASLELFAPLPDNGIFEIGSVTKQFTAASILKLVEAKKLSLDDDFTKYLKFDTKGRKVTIDHLLNHTSGIAGYTALEEFWEMSIMDLPRDPLIRLVESKDFMFEPGEALMYNNSAYFFLGLLIKKITNQSYEEYLQETFFDPLVMTSTSYSSNSAIIKNKVYGYSYTPDVLEQKTHLIHI